MTNHILFSAAARRVLLGATIAVLFWAAAPARLRAEIDHQYLDGLRERRLFSLVESYCRQKMAVEQLPIAERAELMSELLRSYALHAVNLSPANRVEKWEKAEQLANDYLRRHGSDERAVLVRVQQALVHLARGELLRQELEADAGNEGTRALALQEIRKAARLLEQIDEEITRELPRLSGRREQNGGFSYDELSALQNNVRVQLARAFRNRALCYPPASDDRLDALTRAIEQHQALLRKLAKEDPLRWKVELERIACERQLGHVDAARQQLIAFQSEPKPSDVQLEARAEAVRLELAAGRPQKAMEIARQGREVDGQLSAELDFAILQTYDDLAKSADSKQEAGEWRDRSVTLQQVIQKLHGPYWGRRATLLVVRSAANSGDVKNLQVLVQVAEEAWRKQEYADAISAFEKAAAQALKIGEEDQAFALYYKAALVDQQQAQHAAAAVRLRKLGIRLQEHSSASQAHLLACWNAAQVVRSDAASLPVYIELLEEHLAKWPGEATADTVRQWLAMLRQHERAWIEAIDIYLETSPESEQFEKAVRSGGICAMAHLNQLTQEGKAVKADAELLADRFEAAFLDPADQLPESWNPAQREAAVTAARLRLQFAKTGEEAVARYLTKALESSEESDPAWAANARSLLVWALASQRGKSDEALLVLKQTAGASADELFQMTAGLSAVRDDAQGTARASLAQLQLRALDFLKDKISDLDPARQQQLEFIRAGALAAGGRADEARQAFQQLARQNPNNRVIQTEFGRLLLDAADVPTLEAALSQWRLISRRSKPRSEGWYLSKYNIALAQFKLANALRSSNPAQAEQHKKRAAQLLRLLKDTPPGWDKSELKNDFERLLNLCEKS